MHFACVVGKSVSDSIPRCAGVADSTVVLWLRLQFVGCASWTVGAVPDLESAWHGCGVKTNRTKTAPMDISNIGCWLTFWHSFWHSDRLDPSPLNPISLRVSRVSSPPGVFFPARFAEVWTCVSSNLWPFYRWVAKAGHMQGRWVRRTNLCVFVWFFQFSCKHIVLYYIIEGSLEVKLPIIWTDEKQSREEKD